MTQRTTVLLTFLRDQSFLKESTQPAFTTLSSSGPSSIDSTPACLSISETMALAWSCFPAISRYLGDSGTICLSTAANSAGTAPTKNAARHPNSGMTRYATSDAAIHPHAQKLSSRTTFLPR